MKLQQFLYGSLCLISPAVFAGSLSKSPQWVFSVNAPETTMEKQVTAAVKVKIQFEFGENSEDAVREAWSKEDTPYSWNSQPMIWRHPLKGFSIWINGELQGVPYETLAGEGDISGCQIWSSPHEVKVELDGGDAGLAYELTLVFHESKRMPGRWILIKKLWKSGEFSDDVFDQTVYHNDIWDNPDM